MTAQFGTFREEIRGLRLGMGTLISRLDQHGKEIDDSKKHSAKTDQSISELSVKLEKLPTVDKINSVAMKEIDDFTMRKSNVIIYNLPDNQTLLYNILDNLIGTLELSDQVEVKLSFRIGKPVPTSTTPRPLKLRFLSQDQANLFMESFWTTRKSPLHSQLIDQLSLSQDRTPNQLRLYAQCQEDFKTKLLQGQENLKIIYEGYTPRVVRKRPSAQQN